jgi:hypothetical protein
MKCCRQPMGFMVVVALTVSLVLGPGFTGVARAASEDVAMFYDDLSQYGQWVEYDKYGPVWRPSQVPEDWRPYTNGRWVPTDDGNVFESEEPWGWATYHYGNWMPTEGYGWVWVPGSTWYPATVEWRSSPENAPVEDSYIGWAPTPPPDYVPPPAYAPPSYGQGTSITDALTAPLWIFAKAASFLLGFGQPYQPSYSYVSSGVLMPPAYVPVFFSRTVFMPRYVTPAYYPPGFIGVSRFGPTAYNMGPSVAYISRVTRINQTVVIRNIHNNSIHMKRIHNVIPPDRIMRRDAYIRRTLPPNLVQGRPLPPPHPVTNFRMAQANLNRPNFLPPPKGVPPIDAQIPRVQPVAFAPGHGLPGTALPARATMPLTPQMTQQIHQLPPNQQFVPGKSQPFRPVTGTPPLAAPRQPGAQTRPGQFQPGVQTRPGTSPGAQTQPGSASGGPARRGEPHPGAQSGHPPVGTFTPPTATKPGTVPQPQGGRVLTHEQARPQEQERQRLPRGMTSGQPQAQPRDQERLRQQQERQHQQQLQQQQERQRQQQQIQQRQQQERQQQIQIQQQQQRQQQIQQQQRQNQEMQRQQQQIKQRQQQIQMQQQQQRQQQQQQRQHQEMQRQQQIQQRQQQVQPQRQQQPRQQHPKSDQEKRKQEQQ